MGPDASLSSHPISSAQVAIVALLFWNKIHTTADLTASHQGHRNEKVRKTLNAVNYAMP